MNQTLDANKLLIRASLIGNIMPSENARIPFTDTQIDKLVEAYNAFFYDRYDKIESKYLSKGNERENDAITLLSLVSKKFYKKNTERKNNEFFTGEWDLNDDVNGKITEIVDVKSSYSKNTFDKSRVKKLNSSYHYQLQTYMALTGAVSGTIAYCLVNGTHKQVRDEVRRIGWNLGILDGDVSEDKDYLGQIRQMERNHIFDLDSFMNDPDNSGFEPHNKFGLLTNGKYAWDYDVPAKHRVFKQTFNRDENVIKKMQNRVIESRQFITNNLILTLNNE